MATARQLFEAKKLASKYGVVGKVAGRYVTAGFDVKVESTEEGAAYNFTAARKGEKYLVKVYARSGLVPVEVVDKLAEEASKAGARGVLVLYGAGPSLRGEALERAKEKGVTVRRVRH